MITRTPFIRVDSFVIFNKFPQKGKRWRIICKNLTVQHLSDFLKLDTCKQVFSVYFWKIVNKTVTS